MKFNIACFKIKLLWNASKFSNLDIIFKEFYKSNTIYKRYWQNYMGALGIWVSVLEVNTE